MGTMFLERISHAMVLLRLFGVPCTGALHTRTPDMGPLQTSRNRDSFNGYRGSIDYLFVLCPGYSRRNSYHTCNRNRMGFLYNQLCDSHRRYIPHVYMHKPPEGTKHYNRYVETQLWHVPYAHILARTMDNCIQAHTGITNRCRHTMYCSEHIHLLLHNDKDYLVHTGQ